MNEESSKTHLPTIPRRTLLEVGLPVEDLYQLARREGNAKKPIYEIHKWWARRLGHVFRLLIIAATTPAPAPASLRRAAQRLLERFYEPNSLNGLVVLDPFMGGGTSVVETLKTGARAIGVDVDPVAWFVSKKEVEPFDETRVEAALAKISAQIEAELRNLYTTHDPVSRKRGEIVYAFWVHRITCPDCRHAFDAHPHFRLGHDTRGVKNAQIQDVFCRSCGEVHTIPLGQESFTCSECQTTTDVDAGPIKYGKFTCPTCGCEGRLVDRAKPGQPVKKRLFALEYTIEGERDERGRPIRWYKRATRSDVRRFREAARLLEKSRERLPYPRERIFTEDRFDGRPMTHGYTHYEQLFNARQLYCLSRIYEAVLALEDNHAREYLLLALSDCLASNNELVSYAFGYRKATPLFGIHGYQIPQRPVEGNVWGNPDLGRGSFIRCVKKVIEGKRYAHRPFEYRYDSRNNPVRVYTGEVVATPVVNSPTDWIIQPESRACVLNRSSVDLTPIPDKSVDLVLTDPPFYDNLPYSELSDFYYQWLRPALRAHGVGRAPMTPVRDSLFVRRKTVEEHDRYLVGLTGSLRECARVLKPDGMLAFTFHHRDPRAWQALAVALGEAGFRVTGLTPVRAEGVSGFHSYAGTPKWDAVICCRRQLPLPGRRIEPAPIHRMLERILTQEQRWTERLTRSQVAWTFADRASLAFAFALREAVNSRLSREETSRLLLRVSDNYPQKGIPGSMPGQAPRPPRRRRA